MAEYKGIKGFKVQTVSTDPAASIIASGTWASGGDINTARANMAGSGTTSNAALVFAGYVTDYLALTESYNGTSWTEVNDLNTARYRPSSSGTQTAALCFNGEATPGNVALNESWNGTSWTETGDLNTARVSSYGIGTQTSALSFGGSAPPYTGATEEWNGSTWTELNDLNTARADLSGAGTATAGLAMAGESTPGKVAFTELWNGTSWTEVNDMPAASFGSWAMGTQTGALIYGGNNAASTPISTTLSFDGTNWSVVNSLSTAAYQNAGGVGGTNTNAISVGGNTPSVTAATEEWTTTPAPTFQQENLGQVFYNSTSDAFKVTRIVTGTGAWASGGTLNTGRQYMGAAGISDTSALIFSGTSPATGVTESYDGSTWTEVNDMSTGRGYLGGGAGTQTAAIAVGGLSPTNPATNGATEIWDGTNWTTAPSLTRGAVAPQSTVYGSTTGITTSALYIGGGEGTGTDTLTLTEAYNGTSWAEVGDLTTAVSYGAGIGKSDTDALLVTGINWAPGSAINSETNMYYNGTSWTELANVNTARAFLGGGTYGSSTDALVFGGRNQGPSAVYAITESWNGTSWTEVADLGTARMTQGGSGTSASAIYAGGSPYLTITEEWNVPSSTQNQTLTAS
jgi:hypothetical protein